MDAVYPTSQFADAVAARARQLAELSDRPRDARGIRLTPLAPTVTDSSLRYSAVTLALNRDKRTAELTVQAPAAPQPASIDEIVNARLGAMGVV